VLDQPRSPKALYNYGADLFVRKGDLVEAERVFQGVLQMVPDHLLSLQCLADIALKRGDAEQLERWYRRILEIKPGEPVVTEQLEKLRELKSISAPVG
jgi:Tfp pilus assembly protein PilF